MKIAIAARGLSIESGGVKEYIKNLTTALVDLDRSNHYTIYNTDERQRLDVNLSHVTQTTLPNAPNLIWDHVILPIQLLRDHIDLTLYPKGTIPLIRPGKSITTIHDLAYFLSDLKAYKPLDTAYMKWAIPFSARHSNGILAVSHNTKSDIHRFIGGIDDSKITVTYEAPAWPATNSDFDIRTKHGLGTTPYIFFSASVSKRKNIERLLFAIEKVKDHIPHNLVITGGKSWGNNKMGEIAQKSGLFDRFIRLGHVDSEDIPHLYKNADLYIMPSLYEGFSLTLLEAMQEGCPVVASNVSSHPEVVGIAAVMFDPYSIDDMANAILRVATDSGLQSEMRQKGYDQARRFSWERCARETLEVIEKVGADKS